MKRNSDYKYILENRHEFPDIPNDVMKKRKCLMCGKMFNSKSKGNRRCQGCSKIAKYRCANNMFYPIYKISEISIRIRSRPSID